MSRFGVGDIQHYQEEHMSPPQRWAELQAEKDQLAQTFRDRDGLTPSEACNKAWETIFQGILERYYDEII
jgi:hypothetical protein